MFKKLQLLSKKAHKELFFTDDQDLKFAKDLKLVPVGLNEIVDFAGVLPVVIKNSEFIVVSGLPWIDSVFYKNSNIFLNIPAILKAYPFLMVKAKESDDKVVKAVGVDEEALSDNGIALFDGDELSNKSQQKVKIAEVLDIEKQKAAKLIEELNKYNLLVKKSFDIKLDDKTKPLLSDFYVVDRKKLLSLNPELLNKWTKNGILFLLESHINSIKHITNLFKIKK